MAGVDMMRLRFKYLNPWLIKLLGSVRNSREIDWRVYKLLHLEIAKFQCHLFLFVSLWQLELSKHWWWSSCDGSAVMKATYLLHLISILVFSQDCPSGDIDPTLHYQHRIEGIRWISKSSILATLASTIKHLSLSDLRQSSVRVLSRMIIRLILERYCFFSR